MLPAGLDKTTAVTGAMDSKEEKASESSILLCLPLELRRQIYRYSLLNDQNPSTKTIYLSRLPINWRDQPSPLLLVNGQVRDEVIELVQTDPISLRVTHQGVHFDGLGETCLIAQRHPRDYSRISRLCVNIWPPHLDRPIDILHIWRHLRTLRTELRNMPLLEQVSFFFRETEMTTWTIDGEPLDLLESRTEFIVGLGEDDITTIMDLFARVRVAKATFHMPHGLAPGPTAEFVDDFLQSTNAMMMGRIPIDEDVYNDEDEKEDGVEECWELALGYRGACIARDKLDARTKATDYIDYDEWCDFIDMWEPDFERLVDVIWTEDDARDHYVKDRPYDSY